MKAKILSVIYFIHYVNLKGIRLGRIHYLPKLYLVNNVDDVNVEYTLRFNIYFLFNISISFLSESYFISRP